MNRHRFPIELAYKNASVPWPIKLSLLSISVIPDHTCFTSLHTEVESVTSRFNYRFLMLNLLIFDVACIWPSVFTSSAHLCSILCIITIHYWGFGLHRGSAFELIHCPTPDGCIALAEGVRKDSPRSMMFAYDIVMCVDDDIDTI